MGMVTLVVKHLVYKPDGKIHGEMKVYKIFAAKLPWRKIEVERHYYPKGEITTVIKHGNFYVETRRNFLSLAELVEWVQRKAEEAGVI